ncbi:MAG TPA: GNAT family N-acetyltransferase [Pseudohongiella sp.]|nr:GNAT family N-acetyltransferase [Gammaproteobacteria bacterium]HBN13784.1 GNAT family N-acetyltransferase [Pseudohongiella sp.]|tara:strand:+ start:279 stop:809 length:531 start_codon:yes stop_codon:yes gene_type:complete
MASRVPKPAFTIRDAVTADLPVLVNFLTRLALHVNGGLAMQLKKSEYQRLYEVLENALESPDKRIVVADLPGVGLIGMGDVTVWSSQSIWEQATVAEYRSAIIDDIWVEPDYRKAGIFKALLKRLVEFADERGAYDLVLEYSSSNKEAKQAWTRLGFVTTGIRAAAFTQNVKEALK